MLTIELKLLSYNNVTERVLSK